MKIMKNRKEYSELIILTRDDVNDDMKVLGLRPQWAVFRDIWRNFIRAQRGRNDVFKINDDDDVSMTMMMMMMTGNDQHQIQRPRLQPSAMSAHATTSRYIVISGLELGKQRCRYGSNNHSQVPARK